jgi:tRNA threonylcarbamoyladenosine biosynthesis protein TsaE
MSSVITIIHQDQLSEVALKILQTHSGQRHFAFEGEMGAGKTSLIKGICKALGCSENITSPTFSIVNTYQTINRTVVYHFDFYRIKNINEVYDMGYEDYFHEDAYCFIEWPEKVKDILPKDIVFIKIEVNHKKRSISY